jgi:hypothetical protein
MSGAYTRALRAPVTGFFRDTPVLTTAGYRPIGDLSVGDKILTPTGEVDTICEIKQTKRMASRGTLPYVIPKGVMGAHETIYVAPFQRISSNRTDRLCEIRTMGEPVTQIDKYDRDRLIYYNIRLTLKEEYNILVAGIVAEPIPANNQIEVTRGEFCEMIHELFGERPDDRIIKTVFKYCRKTHNGRITIPQFIIDL